MPANVPGSPAGHRDLRGSSTPAPVTCGRSPGQPRGAPGRGKRPSMASARQRLSSCYGPGSISGHCSPTHEHPKYTLPGPMEVCCGRWSRSRSRRPGKTRPSVYAGDEVSPRKHLAGFGKGAVGPGRKQHTWGVLGRGARPDRVPTAPPPAGRRERARSSPPGQTGGAVRGGSAAGPWHCPGRGQGPRAKPRTRSPGRELSGRKRSTFKPHSQKP